MTKRKDLTTDEKQNIYHALLVGSKNGKPQRGKMKELSITYSCCPRSISRIWAESCSLSIQAKPVIFKNKKKLAVRPKLLPDIQAIMLIEPHERQYIRDLALKIQPSKSTIGRWMLLGFLNFRTNAMKPDLTNACKLIRLKFSLSFIHKVQPENKLMFQPMQNIVHLDEKWFNQRRIMQRMIAVPGEDDPHRTGNKCHIPKVMFIAAVSKPIYAPNKTCVFNGKIGVWSFTKKEAARRRSRNRPAGTEITVTLPSINKDVLRDTLVHQIIPAIKQKWPHWLCGKTVYIQQDNATPHIKDDDPIFRMHASSEGWNIRLVQQPANSPDMNINDLGWFRALQSLQHKKLMKNIDELIKSVEDSFEELSDETLSDVWLSLQSCMIEVLKCRGGNKYKVPHMGKKALRRSGNLPDNLEVDQNLVRDCLTYLMEQEGEQDFFELTQSLGVTFMLG